MRLMGLMRLMGPMGLMRHMRHICLMGLIGLMSQGLIGCSSDEEQPWESQLVTDAPIEVTSYVKWLEDPEGSNQAHGAYGAYGAYETTRAWEPPTGYSLFEEPDEHIGIAFTQNGQEPQQGNFFKSGSKWRTNVGDITAGTYYLYGYQPNSPSIGYGITDRDGANANYSDGAKVTLENVPAVMPGDLCVVIGAKDGTDKETVTGLRRGDFGYAAKAISGDVDNGNYVFLLFDHLYAALRVKMRVHGSYDALRTIKLKSLRLKIKAGDTPSTTKTDILVDLKATEGDNPIQSITYTSPVGAVAITDPLEFWSSAAGETLTTKFSTHVGHFMPKDITTLILTSKYDVYDKKDNLIRKDCMATNTMVLNDLLTGQTTTRRGCRYTVNMTIKPTYLYVMSEPDLDSPTVTVE